MIKAIAAKRKAKSVVKAAKRKRDEVILCVGRQASQKRKAGLKKADAKLIKVETKSRALKLELKATSNAKKREELQRQLEKSKVDVSVAKRKDLKAKYAPVAKEVGVITKIEKSQFVRERNKALVREKNKQAAILAQLQGIVESLKRATDPSAILKLSHAVVRLKSELLSVTKKVNRKQKKLERAKEIKASPQTVLETKVRRGISRAKRKVVKEKLKIKKLEEKVNTSTNPSKVAKAVRKISAAKKNERAERRSVARRQARVTKLRKVELSAPTAATRPSKLDVLSQSSPQISSDVKQVSALEAKRKAAKEALAVAINSVVKRKAAEEKSRLQRAKQSVSKDETSLKRDKRRSEQADRKQAADGKTSALLKRLKSAWIKGDYNQAFTLHKKHKTGRAKEASSSRSVAAKALRRSMYNPPDSTSGMCRTGECCLTSYADAQCRVKRASLCVPVTSKPLVPQWRRILPIKATFHRRSTQSNSNSTLAYNRTMIVEALWVPRKNSQALRLRVCGKFGKYGAQGNDECYPAKDEGFSLGQIFNAPSGACIRSSDFAAVAKTHLQSRVRRMKDKPQAAKKTASGSKKRPGKTKSVTNMISRAMAGAFKGGFSGMSLGETSLHKNIGEGLDAIAKDLFAAGGSFRLTSVSRTPSGTKGNNFAAQAEDKFRIMEEDLVDLSV